MEIKKISGVGGARRPYSVSANFAILVVFKSSAGLLSSRLGA